MSEFDPIRDCKHGHQKGKCDSCDLEQAADLLEQQQQRIAELERERDELAAHVELVKKIFITLNSCHLNSDWNENAGKLRSVIMQTPTHSLAEHDAEVITKFTRKLVEMGNVDSLKNETTGDNYLCVGGILQFSNEYAKRIKDGE